MSPQQIPHKLFIQMSGAPGSGKSTMARLLGRSIGGVVIDHDVLRSAFLESGLPFDQAATHAYQLQWMLAQDLIEQGLCVVVDSTCNFQEVLDNGSAIADKHGYTYWYVECKVQDVDLLDRRLRARNPMTSQRTSVDCPPAAAANGARKGDDSRALFKRWIENPYRPKFNVVTVDSTQDPETLRDHVLKQIID
ncbi:P-loop containing nucleoside triphosphate hydrolase protein [Truncatella angustata]|uniref:P-loop containing nucleoside triphosphate hydrolase protein n=1 Tax=Truncatella angustata TaxID=152316 RepID=A0A9P8ZXS1_9PEZI|nr:P-loop containing nucleoside triphosphate hydrolase protein [Truncatella angustata]KAH6654289.1 P-loop containing nucleoside triphosphate hydrolase protein [Truncatella angustata]